MKDIFVSKIKRLAVAIFAALCVGNVWGAYAVLRNSTARIEDGDFKFTTLITQMGSESTRYGFLDAEVWNDKNEVVIPSTRLINGQVFANKSNGYKASFDCVFEDVGTTTGCSTIEEFYDKGYCVKLTFNGTKKTTYTELDCPAWEDLVFCGSGITSLNASFTVNPKEFVISGEYDKTAGITDIEFQYALNDASMSNPKTQGADINEDGTFKLCIPYQSETDIMYYKAIVVKTGGKRVFHRNPENAIQTYEMFVHEGSAAYTWTGESDTSWNNALNWTYEGESKMGYPGLVNHWNYYVSKASFNSDAEVDLNGGKYFLWDNNRGFSMAEGITVKIKNGTLGFQPHDDGSPVTLNFGKKNSILHLNNVAMPYNDEEIYDKTKARYKEYDVMLVADSTVIVEGNQEYIWRFYPGNARTKFKVANGIIQMKHRKKEPGADSEVEISNAVWVLSTCIQTAEGFPIESCQYGLAKKTIFRDGPDRQAQLIFREKHTSGSYYNLKLVGTYDFKPLQSKMPYITPYLTAGGLSTGDACTISVDVSELGGYAKIPLMKFTSGGANVATAMNTMVTDESKLVVTANRRNVKNRQRAKLVWDETAMTLYYEQDPVKGFRVIVR